MAYDAIWALAHALDNVTQSGGTLGEHAETIEALRHVRFDGASGEVRFDENLDRRGKYDIMQFRGGSAYDIGTWAGPGQVTVFPGGDAAIPSFPVSSIGACPLRTVLIAIGAVASAVVAAVVGVCWRNSKRGQTAVQQENEEDRRRWEEQARRLRVTELEAATQPETDSEMYSTFISHHKGAAGQTAGNLKKLFDGQMELKSTRHRRIPRRGTSHHFLDVENLGRIDHHELIKSVRSTEVLVLLLSRKVMERPWCLVEIWAALTYGIPIVPVELELDKDEDSWPRRQRVEWPTGAELRRLCNAYQSTGGGLKPWVDAALPVHPPAAVEAYHDRMREKLASYPRRKYDVQATDAIRAAMESTIVEAIATARQRGREERVLFEVPTTTEMLIQTGSAPSAPQTDSAPSALCRLESFEPEPEVGLSLDSAGSAP